MPSLTHCDSVKGRTVYLCTNKSIMTDTIMLNIRFAAILNWCFSENYLIRKLERFLLTSVGVAIFS